MLFETFWIFFFPNIFDPQLVKSIDADPWIQRADYIFIFFTVNKSFSLNTEHVVVVQLLSNVPFLDPCLIPGSPVLHYLPEYAQIHVH